MNIMALFNALPGAVCPGTDMGNHGNRRVYYLQNSGPCGFDRGWNHVYRRRGLHHDDDDRDIPSGFPCLVAFIVGMLAGLVTGCASFLSGNPGNSGRYSDPAWPCIPST